MNANPIFQPEGVSNQRLLSIFTTILAITAAADFLFWYQQPGLSLAIFLLVLAAAIFTNRTAAGFRKGPLLVALLLLGTAWQTALELSFSNLLVALVLLILLSGECFFPTLSAGWPRWSEALWSLAKTPARWLWLLAAVGRRPGAANELASSASRLARVLQICLPALLLTVVFAFFLGNGNAVFGRFLSTAEEGFVQWLTQFDLSAGRVFFWIGIAWAALPWAQPGRAPAQPRWWTRRVPTLPAPRETSVRLWQSRLILTLLNLLFCAVNTIDALFLWVHHQLPGGVNFSSFVHQGVFSLVSAVLLSALVLTAIFQQADAVARARSLRLLALVWIAQNLVLVASVLLRLKLYVEAYQLSTQRVYVALFLLLVATGFVLLAIHIQRRHTLNWLLFTNLAATFTLFYLVQFADVACWVAEYNVAEWRAAPERKLDFVYLWQLGPTAWPALAEVARGDYPFASASAREKLALFRASESHYLATLPWRSWQGRRVRAARALLASPTP